MAVQFITVAAALAATALAAGKSKQKASKPGVALHKALLVVSKAASTSLRFDVPPDGWTAEEEEHKYKSKGVAIDLGASYGPGLVRNMKRMGLTPYAVAQIQDPFDDERPRLMTSLDSWKSSTRTGGRKLLYDDLLEGETSIPSADVLVSVGWGHLVHDGAWTKVLSGFEKLSPKVTILASSSPGEAEAMSCWGAAGSQPCREALDYIRADREREGTNISLPSPLQGERYPLSWTDGLFQDKMEVNMPWTSGLRDRLIQMAIELAQKIPEFKGLGKQNFEGNDHAHTSAGVPGRSSDAPPALSAEEADAVLEGYMAGLPEGLQGTAITPEDRAKIGISASRVAEWLQIVYMAKNALVLLRFDPQETVDGQRVLDSTFGFPSEMAQWFQPEIFSRQIARAGAVLRLNDTITLADKRGAADSEAEVGPGGDVSQTGIEGEDGFEFGSFGSIVWTEKQARSFELSARRIARRWVLEEARSYRTLMRVTMDRLKEKSKFVQDAIKHAYPHTVDKDPDSVPAMLLRTLKDVPDMLEGMLEHCQMNSSRMGRLVNQAHLGVVGLEEEAAMHAEAEEEAKEKDKSDKKISKQIEKMKDYDPSTDPAEASTRLDLPDSGMATDPSKATLEPDGGQTGGGTSSMLDVDDAAGDDGSDGGMTLLERIDAKLADILDESMAASFVARLPTSVELAAAFANDDFLEVHRLLLIGLRSIEREEPVWLGATLSAADSEGHAKVQETLRQMHRFAGELLHYLSHPSMTISHLALADPWTRAAGTMARLFRVTGASVQQGLYDASGTAHAIRDLSGSPAAVAQLLLVYSLYSDARISAEQLWPQRAGLADAWAHTQIEVASSGGLAHPTFARRMREMVAEIIALRPRWANERTQAVLNTLRTKATKQSKKLLKRLKQVAAGLDKNIVAAVVKRFVEDANQLSAKDMEVLSQLDRARELAKSVVLDVTEQASPPRVLGFVDRQGELELSRDIPMHRQETPLSAGLVQSTRPWLPAFAHRHDAHFLMPYAFPAAERLLRRSYAGHLMSLPMLDGITNVYDTPWGGNAGSTEQRSLLVISSQWKPLHSVHRNFAPMLGAALGRQPAPWSERRSLGGAEKATNGDAVFDKATLLFLESQQLSLADADLTLFDDARALPTNASAHDIVEAVKWARAQGFSAVFFPQIGMHAYDYLLATYRMAPMQIATYGHSTTTDMPEIDVFIGSVEGELGSALICGLDGGKPVVGADECESAFTTVDVIPEQENHPLTVSVRGNATRRVVTPLHYKSESEQAKQQLSVALGPIRKTQEAQRLAEAAGIEQHGIRRGLIMSQSAETVLKEAALDPLPNVLRPVYVGAVNEIRTVIDGAGAAPEGKNALAMSILDQQYRPERGTRRDSSARLQLLGVGRALVSAANRFSERLVLVDGLAAAFVPAPSSVAARPSASYRPAFMLAGNESSNIDTSGWDGSFPVEQQPALPSERGGIMLAGGSRGGHSVLGDLLDGGTDEYPHPDTSSMTRSAVYAGAPAEECLIVALAWTAVKMNADHLAMVGDALRMAAEMRNSTDSSPCTILRVFPGLKKEKQLQLRALAFDIAAGVGLSTVPGLKLEIVPGMDYVRYRAKLRESAFAIDSYPFTGCNSMHDLLYSGVPAVSLEGKPWRSRIGPALLGRSGLGYLVAQDVDQFRQAIVGMMLSEELRIKARSDLAGADLDARLGPSASDEAQWRVAFRHALQLADTSKMMGQPRASDAYYEHYTVQLSGESDMQEGPMPDEH